MIARLLLGLFLLAHTWGVLLQALGLMAVRRRKTRGGIRRSRKISGSRRGRKTRGAPRRKRTPSTGRKRGAWRFGC